MGDQEVAGDERTAEEVAGMAELAELVRAAIESPDLAAYGDLLDPDVRWGAPDDPTPSCRNRGQVLAWYARGREAGVRAPDPVVTVAGDKLLVGLTVTAGVEGGAVGAVEGGAVERWQVLTLSGGRIADIRAYDDRDEAAARAGVSL
jgi:ketosteroid isomerase-like protein